MHSALLVQLKASPSFLRHTLFCSSRQQQQQLLLCKRPGSKVNQAVQTAAMSTQQPGEVQISAAFATGADEAAFSSAFKLAEGSNVNLHMPRQTADGSGSSDDAGSAAHGWLSTATVFKHLSTRHMGHVLLSTPSIPSTQEFMRQHTSVLPDGAVLVADQQTKGKGRGGNVWTSPAGCLMFTALRQLQVQGAQAAFINYVVCLAVVKGIKEATQHLLPGGLDVQIKWPNDIYFQGVKIGGALIHTTWAASSQQFCVLTGIGLNVSNSQPTTCLDDIVQSQHQQHEQQQQQPASTRVCKEQLLACVLNHLESCFDTFQSHGFDPLRQLYLSSWMHSNQVVELEDGTDQASAPSSLAYPARRIPLTIIGLSPHGFLLATDPLGQEYELTPDGNSLDMMQGLIKKKLH